MRQMKDSGIEWIGKIPIEWGITKVKRLFNLGRGRVISNQEMERNGLYPVYSSQTINNGCMGYIETYDFNYPQITWTTDGVNAGTIFLREGKYNCTNVCGTLNPINNENHLKYFSYYLSIITNSYKRKDINGAKIMNNEMAQITLILPSNAEQKTIANYLDEKCSEIDTCFIDVNKSIAKLQEYKKSIITEAVTKGLDTNAAMKDSGIEWIGEIPKGWYMKKLKYIVNLINERADSCNNNYIGLENIESWTSKIIAIENENVESGGSIFKQGDLLFGKLRPYLAKATISSYDGVCSSELLVLRTNYFKKYILYSILNDWFINLVDSSTYGAKMPRASWNFIGEIKIPICEMQEQQQIADYLDNKCAEIDNVIEDKKELAKKLKEYKNSLIYECVTGKREVG